MAFIQFTLLMLFSLISAYAKEDITIWTAIHTGSEMVTSQEVNRYVENILMSDNMHRAIFHESKEDFGQYQENIRKITEASFQAALKRIAFLRLIQQTAIKQTNRAIFTTTSEELNQLIKKKVNLKLGPYKSENNSNEIAIKELVHDLKISGFPYSLEESDSAIYKRWLNRLSIQVKEEIRERDALRFICSIGRCDEESIPEILNRKIRIFQNLPLRINLTSDFAEVLSGDEAIQFVIDTPLKLMTTQSSKKEEEEKRYAFIGKVIDQKVEFTAINDWDITNVLKHLGYPHTDDFGRTSGLMLNYRVNGTEGNINIELINWLFSEKLETINNVRRQNVEEEATLRITSRQFLDSKGDRWIILGVAANHRIQEPNVHSWIQEAFHTLNPMNGYRENVSRDGREIFLEGIIGAGGQFSIIDKPHVDIKITGEGVLIPTIGTIDRSRITLSTSLDSNFYLKHKEYPLFFASFFASYSFLTNGGQESMVGSKAGVGVICRNVYLQASLFVIRWDTALDRRYEGGASWTTGVSISATFISKKPKPDYIFN